MSCWFVSRHSGAQEWAATIGIEARVVRHLDIDDIQAGDIVLGTLPVHLAAEVCQRGARYIHLTLDLTEDLRGQELTAEQLIRCNARLVEYRVERQASVPCVSGETPD